MTYNRRFSNNSIHSKSSSNDLSNNNDSNSISKTSNILESFLHKPGLVSFNKQNSKLAIENTEFMKKLISGAVAERKTSGDMFPRKIIKKCCELYNNLDEEDRIKFITILARDFGKENVIDAAQHYVNLSGADAYGRATLRAEQILRHAIIPSHNVFFDRINELPEGTKFLIDMRADLLSFIKENVHDVALSAINENLKEKLATRLLGSIDLKQITWNSPVQVLEKIKEYEVVHPIKDWQDMKRRVGPGRHMFAFFCSRLPYEPLVFIHVAFTKEISGNVQAILEESNPETSIKIPEDIKCAIFYSITRQPGLSGIELGNFLIRSVVRKLQAEFSSIETFSTLSPIPGFRRWLVAAINIEGDSILVNGEAQKIKELGARTSPELYKTLDKIDATRELYNIIKTNEWSKDEYSIQVLRPILMRLCARYILTEKRRNLALDPVANFHIRNGACVYRLNWLGDTSEQGFEKSFGIMINYNYVLEHLEGNNKQYLSDGTITIPYEDPVLIEEAKNSPNVKII
ncbi:3821_t:CDS:10 [Cetraspora pellucida]|uniref:3821_t:CDS:1 n=1 Tax=Cetraspora pellucida TaxID=1433469 RepID=A0ACA9KM20_9GLOM|nr:3821_t:CDS:10 [Cetraspora pellucida]